jgi:predicted transcriptional regulator of viral defense system
VRASSVRLLDHDYLLSHVSPEALEWGLKTEWRGEVRLRLADPARTVVDTLDTPRLGGGIRHSAEILAAYLNDHDPAIAVEYGDRLGNRTLFKRLGYLVETLELDRPELVSACRERVSAGISLLDPDGPKDGPRVSRWGLRVNVRLEPVEPS